MDNIFKIILYSFFSGITVLLGGLLSRWFERFGESQVKERVIHTSVAFGGGILIAAVAFVLVPKAMPLYNLPSLIIIFLAGAVAFFAFDRYLARKGGTFAQVMAMMMDYVPEAIALGAVFAHDHKLGLLLALFIGLQNLPEAFNAYRDLRYSGFTPNKAIMILLPLSFVGIGAALFGDYVLSESAKLVSGMMLFAGSGILYLMFQDIVPLAKMKGQWSPAFGATLGFLIGLIGQKLLG